MFQVTTTKNKLAEYIIHKMLDYVRTKFKSDFNDRTYEIEWFDIDEKAAKDVITTITSFVNQTYPTTNNATANAVAVVVKALNDDNVAPAAAGTKREIHQ